MNAFLAHATPIRLGFFFGLLAIMAVWEIVAPRRALQQNKPIRWTNNLALTIISTLADRALLPVAAIGVAAFAAKHGLGLLHLFQLPYSLAVMLSLLVLDLAIYLQHRMFHAVPLLWRLHRVHHADLDFDVTTGARFHPLEILLSTVIKFAVILVVGPPAVAVLVFEILLNATSMFNHSNVRIPMSLDRFVRGLVVTPDMHRVHHSIKPRETNSNFGFNLSWWDRLFGTYRAQPEASHGAMTLGIDQFRSPRELWLDRMLLQPFHTEIGRYSTSRRHEVMR
jgi:sterol desaturase/sphingolipid hydroxylase (fatty acid hydroxylase superfamily)